MKPMIYIPDVEEKERAIEVCNSIVKILEQNPLDFQAFCLQMILETFESEFDIDIRGGISFKQK